MTLLVPLLPVDPHPGEYFISLIHINRGGGEKVRWKWQILVLDFLFPKEHASYNNNIDYLLFSHAVGATPVVPVEPVRMHLHAI